MGIGETEIVLVADNARHDAYITFTEQYDPTTMQYVQLREAALGFELDWDSMEPFGPPEDGKTKVTMNPVAIPPEIAINIPRELLAYEGGRRIEVKVTGGIIIADGGEVLDFDEDPNDGNTAL
ncbi:MAG: hypothetical protein LBM66_04725 [Bifidobacteriaceae bacterium]|jgi:hypothetical protein|nr:hypothetical protein [Bifidobacteriaceae bacterium]